MTKKLLTAALILTGASAIAGPLDYNRINLTGEMLFDDDDDAQAINFTLNERLENGFFYEINAFAVFIDSEDVKTLQGVWGYSFEADNVDFALSLVGNRIWSSVGVAETVKTYNAELTLPLASNLYLEAGYTNTFLEDFKSEDYKLSLEGGKFDGFQWELTTQPKEDDENLRADFYIPTSRDGKWVVGASVINSDDVTYGIHGGYHWIFGAAAPRKTSAAAIAPAAAKEKPAPVVNDNEAVDPIAPDRIDGNEEFIETSEAEFEQMEADAQAMEAKGNEEADRMQADADDMEAEAEQAEEEYSDSDEEEPTSQPASSSSEPEDDYDDDLDFLFE